MVEKNQLTSSEILAELNSKMSSKMLEWSKLDNRIGDVTKSVHDSMRHELVRRELGRVQSAETDLMMMGKEQPGLTPDLR